MVSQPGRILVVEDDARTAEVIALYLRHAGYQVWVEGDGTRALERARADSFDLLILDRMLPGIDGLTLCRQLTAESGVPVMLVTARTLEEERLEGFEGGADDYITKPFSPRELVARATAILRRAPPGQRDVVRAGILRLDLERREVKVGEAILEVTPSEFEILHALAEHPGRVCSRAALLNRLPGRSRDALDRTVDVHVRNLRRKLESLVPAPDAFLETAFGQGYRLGAEAVS
ncbi:MAG: response regulator transcription factor [Gemmatimonadales bacterium]